MAVEKKTLDENRTREMEELAAHLGFPGMDPELLHLALCHSSYANEQENCENFGNERLEFLGDAVVGYTITEDLYNRYPHLREGQLSKIKSVVVSKRILAQRTHELGLSKYLLLGKGEEQTGGLHRFSILGTCSESVVGRFTWPAGSKVQEIRDGAIAREIDKSVRGESIIDYKSAAGSWCSGTTACCRSTACSRRWGRTTTRISWSGVRAQPEDRPGRGKSKKRAERPRPVPRCKPWWMKPFLEP